MEVRMVTDHLTASLGLGGILLRYQADWSCWLWSNNQMEEGTCSLISLMDRKRAFSVHLSINRTETDDLAEHSLYNMFLLKFQALKVFWHLWNLWLEAGTGIWLISDGLQVKVQRRTEVVQTWNFAWPKLQEWMAAAVGSRVSHKDRK